MIWDISIWRRECSNHSKTLRPKSVTHVLGTLCNAHVSGPDPSKLVEPMGFESTHYMITKEFCGAPWPSKVLKGKKRNS